MAGYEVREAGDGMTALAAAGFEVAGEDVLQFAAVDLVNGLVRAALVGVRARILPVAGETRRLEEAVAAATTSN
jgi:hypothetical protein